ncbi:unnamed protein product [Effrenium voratum]|uniref:U2 snRNP-associated SURP motif-containing protein n=1 Tax=Effrenium voratum TaxID=2562239 RepID=A0AA36IYA7_9DINO|nr:unnamed protein product [Effrenium voratum]CAJ1448055.1 unnamed protein product [Effrenium voratum]
MNGAMNRSGPWPGKGLPAGMGFSGGCGTKGGKGKSESMSLLEEMKLKQEKREQRKRLREEVEALLTKSPQDVMRISRLRQELSYVEGFLAQADGHMSLPTHQPQPTGPLTVAEGQDTNNLYVGSLSTEWTEEMLSREFGRFGEVTSIKIMYPRNDQQRLRGMNSGFVQFKTRHQAELARLKLNGKEYFGMCLRIDWGRAIQPVRNVSAIMSMGMTPNLNVVTKPALMPHIEPPKPKPMPMPMPTSESSPASSSTRKSRWNLAKTLVVKPPEDQLLKKLIDTTAEFVADEGWEFERVLLEREKDNPRFAFISTDKENLEEPLHVYYRWRTFSYSQGDNDKYWRTEPFQIYENGPLWQPPPCEKRMEGVPEAIQRIEMLMPSAGQGLDRLRKLTSASVSTSGKDNVIGGAGLTQEESAAFQELIGDLSLSRALILKAMVFCVDKSMSSLAIAQKIGASITEAQLGLTTQQLVARLYLLNDVLYNSHCTKPGASQYRRKFQDLLPDVVERLREVCDGISTIAASSLRDRVLKLVENWSEWALFPPRFTKGLEAVMCGKAETGEKVSASAPAAVQQAQQHWMGSDLATLERACQQRGLSIKGSRQRLLERLLLFEAYWPPDAGHSEPRAPKDLRRDGKAEPGLDGEPCDCEEETRPPSLRILLLPERWLAPRREGPAEPRAKKAKTAVIETEGKEARKDSKEKAKEPKPAKSPEERRRERLQKVEVEVGRYRVQLEKAREPPEVVQMKCDRRRMELLEAAAHQETWSEHKMSSGDAGRSGSQSQAKQKDVMRKDTEVLKLEPKADPEAKSARRKDIKSGREKDKDVNANEDGKATKEVKPKEEPAKAKAAEKDKEKAKEKAREKDKDKEKEKEREKEKDKEKEKNKERKKRSQRDRSSSDRPRRKSSPSRSRKKR